MFDLGIIPLILLSAIFIVYSIVLYSIVLNKILDYKESANVKKNNKRYTFSTKGIQTLEKEKIPESNCQAEERYRGFSFKL
jgi:hypothetical protein